MTAGYASPAAFLGQIHDNADALLGFRFGQHLHGAFGGAFGGAVAAGCVLAARGAASPGLVPASLDVRFMRGIARSATLRTEVLHSGRSLTTISVDVADETGQASARATVGLIAPGALEPVDHPCASITQPFSAYADGTDWHAPKGVQIPILSALHPRVLGSGAWGVATGISLPWPGLAYSAEAICLAADMCVGPPVAAVCDGRRIPHPNPDLSLRFVGTPTTGDVDLVAVGRAERVDAGLAAVAIQVFCAEVLVGIGVSTSMLLATATDSDRQ